MKRLPEDFKPTERTYNNLRKHGAIPEFVDDQIDDFMAYWLDPELPPSKAKKSSWQKTFQTWMRRAWKGKTGREWENDRDRRRMYGRSGSGGFEQLTLTETPPKPQPRRRAFKTVLSPAAQAIQDMSK